MTWATVTEFLYHKWPWKCSVCRNHKSGHFLIHDYHRGCNKNNTAGATSGEGNTHPFEASEFNPCFCGVCMAQSICFCISLFVLFSFFFWPLYCLAIYLRRLYPLVSSNVYSTVYELRKYHIQFNAGPPREILQGGTRLLLESRRQAETSLKIEDLRYTIKPLVNFHKCFISCTVECPDNILYTKQCQT